MTGPPEAMTYLCTLDLPDAWFDELSRRVPDVRIVRASPSRPPPTDVVAATTLLHTSEWFPDATAAPSLRCVQLDTSGVDHVRGTSLWRTDVPIATLGGIAPVPMAEHTLMSILALAHQMPRIDQLRRSRTWPSDAERLALLTPRQLAGATLGIVGYGRIGREISRLAAALGMRVLGLRRTAEARRVGEQFDTGRLDEGDDATVVQPMERLPEVLAAS